MHDNKRPTAWQFLKNGKVKIEKDVNIFILLSVFILHAARTILAKENKCCCCVCCRKRAIKFSNLKDAEKKAVAQAFS